MRIHDIAKKFKISSNALINILNELNFHPKSHMSVATDEMIEAVKNKFAEEKKRSKKGDGT